MVRGKTEKAFGYANKQSIWVMWVKGNATDSTGMNPCAERAKHLRAEASPSGFALLALTFTSGLFP